MGLLNDIKELKQFATLSQSEKDALLKRLRKIRLLTKDSANAKTAKNKQFSQYESVILHLSPADIAFKELSRNGSFCPMASNGCKSACLNTAGRGRFTSIQNSRLRKSLYFILFNKEFMAHLVKEISKLDDKLPKGKRLVVRLNGTSDIQWESIKVGIANIFELFSNVQFYDYTKIVRRLEKKLPDNYYLTFSASESNDSDCVKALSLGYNVATVFKEIPKQYNGIDVLNGDEHDLRFLDIKRGVIVGLKAKGKAKKDTSGFVKQTSQCGMVA